jgi:hypothetical protein
MRARYPDTDGFVERNGAKIFYEIYENEGPTVLALVEDADSVSCSTLSRGHV